MKLNLMIWFWVLQNKPDLCLVRIAPHRKSSGTSQQARNGDDIPRQFITMASIKDFVIATAFQILAEPLWP